MSFEDYSDELTKLQKEYSTVKPEEAGGDLPDGDYQVVIHTTLLKRSKTGNLMLTWQLQVISPLVYKKRFLFRHNMLQTRDNLVWLKRDLATCGIDLPDITQLQTKIVELVDRVINVKKETNKKSGFKDIHIHSLVALDVRDFIPKDESSEVPF